MQPIQLISTVYLVGVSKEIVRKYEMEGSSISKIKNENRNSDPRDLCVEEFTVSEDSLDGDTTQHDEADELKGTDKEDEVEQEDGEQESVNMQYEIDDHQYIPETDGYHRLKEVTQTDTKFIICSPDETLETYKTSWTRGMTQILIEEYRNMVADFRHPHKKQKDVWYELASNMCRRGYDVTWDMCDRKWRNLKHTFKTIYYNQHRSAKSKRRWEFYSDLEELFIPQGDDSEVRKSRTISPPLDDQESIPAGITAPVSKLPRLSTAVAPQVSYAQVLDVSNLHSQILSYPQIVLCDESEKSNAEPLSVSSSKSLLSDIEGCTETPPFWFLEFMKQYRIDEERRLTALKEMHAEVIQVEKRKCVALENLVKKLMQ